MMDRIVWVSCHWNISRHQEKKKICHYIWRAAYYKHRYAFHKVLKQLNLVMADDRNVSHLPLNHIQAFWKYFLMIALRHGNVWGSGCMDPRFLYLDVSSRWVVRFTPRPLYNQVKGPWYSLNRRLDGPQKRPGRRGEEKILDPTGNQTPNPRPSIPQPVVIPTALSRLSSFLLW
jgi:hypothetical protein